MSTPSPDSSEEDDPATTGSAGNHRRGDEQDSPARTSETHTRGGADGNGPDEPDENDRFLDAELLPSVRRSRNGAGAVDIRVYVVTGRHGILTVPERFCRECHLFTRRADAAAERVDVEVNVQVLSWWTRFLGALRHGGYHPPVMVVGGKRLCQGHDVPTTDEVVEAIEDAVERNDK